MEISVVQQLSVVIDAGRKETKAKGQTSLDERRDEVSAGFILSSEN